MPDKTEKEKVKITRIKSLTSVKTTQQHPPSSFYFEPVDKLLVLVSGAGATLPGLMPIASPSASYFCERTP